MRKTRKIDQKFIKESLGKLKILRGDFLIEVERERFLGMFFKYNKVFVFAPKEIGCIDLNIVVMVIFTIS